MTRRTHDPKQLPLFQDVPELLTADELFDHADQALLKNLREDRRLERKSAGIHVEALSQYLSMFANTPPEGGVIVIGIEDDGTIAGCKALTARRLNSLERVGDTHCRDARYNTKRIAVTRDDGTPDFLLLMRVPFREDRLVETVKGDAFIRRGGSKKKLSPAQKRELEIERGQVEIELEPCPDYAFPEDFDQPLVNQYVTRWKGDREVENGHLSAAEVLELRHLGAIRQGKFTPNVACVVLFAKDPCRRIPGCKIRFLRFEGEQEGTGQRFNAIKDIPLEGPVPRILVRAHEVIENQIREFSRLGPDGKFYTAPEYPEPAWYEAVVNACVHRSYGLRSMNVFVRMFDDRLEVESPGGFPGIVTPENIYEMHYPRNPHLMDAMYYLDFVKCAREGARRMRDTMAEMRLPAPEFSEKTVSYSLVRVTLRNDLKQRKIWIDSDASAVIGEAISRTLDEHERRAINFVAENQSINVSQCQRLTARSWPAAKRLLMGLVEKGILDRRVRSDLDRDPQAHFVLKGSAAPHVQ